MSKGEKWIKSPWAISIGTAIFSLLLTIGYDYSKEKPILTTVWNIIKWIWDLVINFLSFNLKLWWLIMAALIFIFIRIIIAKFKQEKQSPEFLSYREGKFKKWRWTWEWKWNQSRWAWVISNMRAHCPKCDTSMSEDSGIYGLRFECPRCDYQENGFNCDEPEKIERIILDNIERRRKENEHNVNS